MAEFRIDIPGVAESAVLGIAACWDEYFPGFGPAIAREIVGPFYSPGVQFTLAKPVGDPVPLKQAVFWRPTTGLQIMTPPGLKYLHGSLPSLGASLHGTFHTRVTEQTWRFIADRLNDHLHPSIKTRLLVSAAAQGFESQAPIVETNIWLTMLYAIAFTISRQPEPRLTTILRRYCRGNLALGFDRQDVLLVLCAPSNGSA